MKPPLFAYRAPTTIEDAVAEFERHGAALAERHRPIEA